MVFLLLNEFQVDIKSDEVMRGQVLSEMTLTQIFLQRVKIMKLTKSHYITILTLPSSASYAIQSHKRLNYNTITIPLRLWKKTKKKV